MKHQLFAHHYIITGDKDQAYKIAYPNAEGEPLKNAARRLINHPDVRQYITKRLAEAEDKALQQERAIEQQREADEYASLMLKRKVLRNIISGQQKQQRHFKFKNHLETIEDNMSPFAIIRAIELDTKLAADWYSKKGKGSATALSASEQQEPPKREKTFVDYSMYVEVWNGPEYMAGLRAKMAHDNPTNAQNFKKDGLRVLDYVPTKEQLQEMKERHWEKMEEMMEANKLAKEMETDSNYHDGDEDIELPDGEDLFDQPEPPSIPALYPVMDENHTPQYQQPSAPRVVKLYTTPLVTPITPPIGAKNKDIRHLVNPMSVPPPDSGPRYTPEERERKIQEGYEYCARMREIEGYNWKEYMGYDYYTTQNATEQHEPPQHNGFTVTKMPDTNQQQQV